MGATKTGICSTRTEALLVLGPGLLFAAFLGILNGPCRPDGSSLLSLNSADAANLLFPGVLIGVIAAGVLAYLLPALPRIAQHGGLSEKACPANRPFSVPLVPPMLPTAFAAGSLCAACSCLGMATGLGSSGLGASGAGAGVLWGALFGFGVLCCAVCWSTVLSTRPFLVALKCASCALFVGSCAFAALILLAGATCLPWAALAGILLSWACAALVAREAQAPLENAASAEEEPSPDAGTLRRFAAVAKTTWVALAGLAVCAFLLGLLWNQPAPATGALTRSASPLALAVPIALLGAFAAIAGRLRSYDAAKRLLWTVIPLVAALFLITPNFDDTAVPAWNAAVEGLQNAGSCLQMLCTFAFILTAARANGLPAARAIGATAALVSTAGLAGLAVHDLAGQAGNVVAVVLFVLYACAAIGFLAIVGPGDRAARAQESGALEAYLGPRCNRIVASFGLTQREAEVMRLLARGHSYAFIAEGMYISEATVRTHARNVYRKLGVEGQEGLINLVDRQQV